MESQSITEVAKYLKVHEQTLRKWEKDYELKIPRNEQGHRIYTDKEIKVFESIIKLKEQGANLHLINKILGRSKDALEQKEQALELLTLDKLTGLEFKELMTRQIADLMIDREQEILIQYGEKLERIKEELKHEIREEFTKQQEQSKADNQKFLDYIAATREKTKKKSIWDKIRKKQTP